MASERGEEGAAAQPIASAINRAAGSRPVPGNDVRVLIDGPEAYARMLEVIAQATRWIHFENYIIRSDKAGQWFADALIARARDGISVRVMYDAFGSSSTKRRYWRSLREGGVDVRAFHPFQPLDLVANFSRNHRKLVVADGARGVMGGLCIGDEWLGHPEERRQTLARHRRGGRRTGVCPARQGVRRHLGDSGRRIADRRNARTGDAAG